VALDLAGLYEQLLRPHIPLAPRSNETLAELIARHAAATSKRESLPQLETRLAREKQFNRKVEINAALRQLRAEIDELLA
jgi:hypothetical protein